MSEVWSRLEEVFCIHPGGQLLSGFEAVRKSWADIISAADPPVIDYRVMHIRVAGELAVHLVEEQIRPSGSQAHHARVLATNVYARENERWHMLSHHASLPLIGPAKVETVRKMH